MGAPHLRVIKNQSETMTEAEARACVSEINAGLDSVRRQILELYDREGWRALGYSSWRQCVKAEFPHAKERALYYELQAAQIEQRLSGAYALHNCAKLPESHARELAKLPEDQQAEAYRDSLDEDGNTTARRIAEQVRSRLEPEEPWNEPKSGESESEPGKSGSVPAESAARPNKLDFDEPPPNDSQSSTAQREPKLASISVGAIRRLLDQRDYFDEYAQAKSTATYYAETGDKQAGGNGAGPRMLAAALEGGDLALAVMGLTWSATSDDVRKKYKAYVLSDHPDKGGSQDDFLTMTWARDVLLRAFS